MLERPIRSGFTLTGSGLLKWRPDSWVVHYFHFGISIETIEVSRIRIK